MDKILLCITIVFSTFLFGQNNNLIVKYPLNCDASDVHINSLHGTLNGPSSTANRFNEPNGAMYFNGEGDYIETSNLIDDSLSNAATFSFWMNSEIESQKAGLISNYNGPGNPGDCLERIGFQIILEEDNSIYIIYATNGNDYIGRKTIPNVIQANTWHHIAISWSGEFQNTSFKIYIDGIPIEDSNYSSGAIFCNNYLESPAPFIFGQTRCAGGFCFPFTGSIDDVSIYGKELSIEEIDSIRTIDDRTPEYDTITVIDTIIVYDTIYVYDSVAVTDTLIIDLPLSNQPSKSERITVFPNPTRQYLSIYIPQHVLLSDYNMAILSSGGNLVFQSPVNQESYMIDFSKFGNKGLYILQIFNSQGEITDIRKIILK